ncbi:MAG TPA: HAD family hydrolase [Actinomycetota bacterium]|nr:HAD family hydrolase [Actinomycetota bacterium]
MSRAAIVDIDGTLVDTNYHHAIAWFRAFRAFDVTLPLWRIHRHMGMGGDQLVGSLKGEGFEEERGEEVRAAEKSLYMELIDEVRPMDGARELLEHLKEMDVGVVLASSAKAEEVDHYLDLLDARAIVKGWTTSADVDNTKPEPDLVKAALEKADADESLMIGDSTFDCEAAKRAGIATVAVLTGGFSQQELEEAGAARVYESVRALHEKLEDVPFRVS